jgi:hypothetical protein
MSLLPITELLIEDPFGEIANYYDTTGAYAVNNEGGYGSPNLSYAQVGGVRLLIGNYLAMQAESIIAEDAEFIQYTQYIKTAGADQVYDNKTIGIGDYFIPQIADITVIAGDEFQITGFYNPLISPSRWLPTAAGTPLYLDGNDLGYNTTGVIPDLILTIQYEVYGILATTTFTTTSGVQYLVVDGIVSYLGNEYRQGEVFMATDASSVTLVSGTFGVSPYNSGSLDNFQTIYNIEQSLTELNTSLILNPKPQPREVNYQISSLYAKLFTMQRAAKIGLVSLGQAYDNLLDCTQEVANLNNNIY